MLKFHSSTQKVEALSSGEAEWYALVKTASAGIGLQNLANDLGVGTGLVLAGDATAASGIAHRRGAGKIRHIEVCTLWLQRHITEKRISLHREPGETNPADLGTKYLDQKRLFQLLDMLNFHKATGSSQLALKATI